MGADHDGGRRMETVMNQKALSLVAKPFQRGRCDRTSTAQTEKQMKKALVSFLVGTRSGMAEPAENWHFSDDLVRGQQSKGAG
ncbi:unnamed protein product [Nezara viridula]|uniref:Uncharacterized protein n=1 Tax=Nezara viridula TaxID=85310 RepID=A0A9P0HFB5_NEZVI|nr:unnamed protein product [Nezara viridula]